MGNKMSLITCLIMIFSGLAVGFAVGLVTREAISKPPKDAD